MRSMRLVALAVLAIVLALSSTENAFAGSSRRGDAHVGSCGS
jgi:hypothetical protein